MAIAEPLITTSPGPVERNARVCRHPRPAVAVLELAKSALLELEKAASST